MVTKMDHEKAVSTADLQRERYCLLDEDEAETYGCTETALSLGSSVEKLRYRAYWSHYQTHETMYIRWARNQGWFDPTIRYFDSAGRAEELVDYSLISFHKVVQKRSYRAEKGLPCQYIKRSIKNRFQDILRRGRRPDPEECERCWNERGTCWLSKETRPSEEDRRRCRRLPAVESLDAAETTFVLSGLQDQWPPTARPTGVPRPVENRALADVLLAEITTLAPDVLSRNEFIVLSMIYSKPSTAREIALELQTTPNNVYQLKRRGLRRLMRAIGVKSRDKV